MNNKDNTEGLGKKYRQVSNVISDAEREEINKNIAITIFLIIFVIIACGLGVAYMLGLDGWIPRFIGA